MHSDHSRTIVMYSEHTSVPVVAPSLRFCRLSSLNPNPFFLLLAALFGDKAVKVRNLTAYHDVIALIVMHSDHSDQNHRYI